MRLKAKGQELNKQRDASFEEINKILKSPTMQTKKREDLKLAIFGIKGRSPCKHYKASES